MKKSTLDSLCELHSQNVGPMRTTEGPPGTNALRKMALKTYRLVLGLIVLLCLGTTQSMAQCGPITGTLTVCAGSTTALADTSVGGTWSSGSTGIATIDRTTGVVTGVAAGTSTITYNTGACIATATVTVRNAPGAITGTSLVCLTQRVTLTDTSVGGLWTSSNAGVATIGSTTAQVTGVSPGTAVMSYTLSNGCYATFSTSVMTIGSITGPTSVCGQQQITLADSTPGGLWSVTSTAIALINSTSGLVTGQSIGGVTNITYTVSPGCVVIRGLTVNRFDTTILGTISGGGTSALNKTVCGSGSIGTNLTLSSNGDVFGMAPIWTSSNPAVATIGSITGTVVGVSAGTCIMTLTLNTGCMTSTVVSNLVVPPIVGTNLICLGQSAVLSDSIPGGTWQTGAARISFSTTSGNVTTVTGVSSVGTAPITYTAGGCRSAIFTMTVTAVGAISGTYSVCGTGSTTLTTTSTGGYWSSSDPSIASIGSSTGVVTGSTGGGNVTITYTLSTSCIGTHTFQANPQQPITGPSGVCIGNTITLANATSGGTWRSSATAIATVGTGTGVVTGVAIGTTTISYTLPTGCRSTTIISVSSLTGNTGTSRACVGQTSTLSNSTGGGTWTSSNPAVATVGSSSGVVTGISGGTAVISYALPSGGCYAQTTFTVNPTATFSGSTSVCSGQTSTLTPSVTGGTWSSGSTGVATVGSTSGVVTGVSAGTSILTYTTPTFGCVSNATFTVNTAPGSIGGTTTVCAGNTTTLTNSVSGGIWSSSNTGVALVNSASGDVTGVSAGAATITYSLGVGCIATTGFTVNANPAAITGASSVCVGSTITLSNTTSGGSWSSSGTGVATVGAGTGVVTGVSAGAVTITYALGTGCNATTGITVNAAPATIGGTTTVCSGNTSTLTNSVSGGSWTSSNTGVATINSTSGLLTGVSAGTAVVTYTLSSGCFTTTAITINASPASISGVSSVCAGSTLTLTDATPGGSWFSSNTGVATVGVSTGFFNGVSAGTTTITYMLPTGCNTTVNITVNTTPVAISGGTTACAGSGTTLSNSTGGGVWSSNNTGVATIGSSSGVVSALSSGTAIISYTLSTGCNTVTTYNVNPTPVAIGGTTRACEGLTSTLTNATSGGSWFSSSTGVATVGAGTGVVTGVTAGVTTITYILGTGCYTTATFTVNAAPGGISGASAVCTGSTITLTNGTGGGVWSSTNTGVATIGSSTGVVSGISAGTATISYVLGLGCFATTNITVNQAPATISGASSVCSGNTATMTNSVSGGSWFSSATGVATIGVSTGIATGVSAGTATLSYVLPTGCLVTKLFTVNPNPSSISGTTTLCIGGTSTLTNTVSGGSWTSSNTGVATINSSTGLLTGVSAGTATVTYSLGTSCFAIANITINPNPGAITGTSNVCVGASTTMSSSTSGGAWTSSNTGIATVGVGTGIVSGIAAGTVTLTYSLPTSCIATAVFTVKAAPATIGGTTTLCAGRTTTLTNSVSGGSWSSSNTGVATINSSTGLVTAVAAGSSTITYMLSSGCYEVTNFDVNPNPAAISGTTALCTGNSTTLTDATSGGAWYSSNTGVATIGSTTGIITGVAIGTSTVTYVLSTGCFVTTNVSVNTAPGTISGPSAVCTGKTITLTNSTGGGSWSSSNTGVATVGASTGVVSGVTVGTTTITYTFGGGCSVNTVIAVNANPAAITGTPNVCVGSTTTLADATSGGSWSSANTGVATVDIAGVVSGVSAGVTTITYTVGSGCYSTSSFTVNANPGTIAGNTNVCVGSTSSLTNALSGGTWSSSNTGVATIGASTGILTAVSVGTTIVTYTSAAGCFNTISVATKTTPASITGTAGICISGTTTLSSTTTGGTWSSRTPAVATVGSTTGVVTGISVGTSVMTYSNGCGTAPTFTISVNGTPSAITGTPLVCTGATTTLANATPGGVWSSFGTGILTVGSASGIVTGVAAGSDTVNYTTSCGTTPVVVTVSDPATLTPTASPSSFCLAGTSSLSANAPLYAVYPIPYTLVSQTSPSTVSWSDIDDDNVPATIPFTFNYWGVNYSTVNLGTNGYVQFGSSSSSYSPTAFPTTDIPGAISLFWTDLQVLSPGSVTYSTEGTTPNRKFVIKYSQMSPCCGTFSDSYGGEIILHETTNIIDVLVTRAATDFMVCGIQNPAGTIAVNPESRNGVTYGVSTPEAYRFVPITYTYAWTPGSFLSSPSVANPTATGVNTTTVYTVTATASTTCVSRGSTTVTINTAPSAISGSTSLCVGSSSTLTSPGGGTWTSDATGVATIGVSDGIVSAVSVGTSRITYTLPTGCVATTVVTVYNLAPIAGSSTVCVGSTTSLTNPTGGGVWSSADGAGIVSIGSSSGVITGVAAGTATITYTLGSGCSSTMVMTVNPSSAISGPANVCVGQTVTLTNATPGGTWVSNNVLIASIGSTSGVATGVLGGFATISYILPTTGCRVTFGLNVNPLSSITGASTVCAGQTITLTNVGGGTWSSTDGAVATIGSSSGVVTGVAPGTTTISYVLGTGCTTSTVIGVNPLSPISGPSSICLSQTATMTDATPGGSWSSSNSAVASIDATTGVVTTVTGGVATFSYSLPSGCVATQPITVNLFAPVTGTTSVCQGSTTTLSNTTSGGVWTSSDVLTATVGSATGVVTGVAAGTATISYNVTSGCTGIATVTVSPSSPITGPSGVCVGQTITLANATSGGTWSSTNPTIVSIGSTTGIATGVAGGITNVTYTLGSGCRQVVAITSSALSPISGVLSTCVGQVSTLTEVGSGVWSSSDLSVATIGTSTGVVTGVAAGTTTISYTLSSGCAAVATFTVGDLAPISGPVGVCTGQTVSLTDAAPGGVWTSSNPTFASIGSSSGIVTGVAGGSVTISYSIGSCRATAPITVTSISAITGSSTVCVGLTTTLTSSGVGAWTSSDATIATVGSSTGVVTGVAAGTAVISYGIGSGCSVTKTITVNPLAAIAGPTGVCTGQTITLTNAASGGTWSSSNPTYASVGSTTGIVSGLVGGSVTISYNIGGCRATYAVVVTNVSAIAGLNSVCAGQTITLTASGSGTWSSTDLSVATIGSTSGVVTGVAAGSATISYIIPGGCFSTKTITVNPLAPITGITGMCNGSTITLSSAAPGGVWASSNPTFATIGSSSGIVTGIAGGSVTISYTIGGCRATAPLVVTSLSAISGLSSVCVGQTITLSNSSVGTWSSSDATIASVGSSTGVVTGVAAGNATITFATSICITTKTVAVGPLAPITGPGGVCIGQTITLANGVPGGTWNSANALIARVGSSSGVVTGVGTGVVNISYTVGSCRAIASVAVGAIGPISGPSSVCASQTITLTDIVGGGTWTSSNTAAATVGSTNGIVAGVAAGTTTITYMVGSSSCMVTKSLTVIDFSQILPAAPICVGQSITLVDLTPGGTWISNNATIATVGSTTGIVTGITGGYVTITYFITSTGCRDIEQFMVNRLSPIAGPTSVCEGQSINLTDAEGGGTWSSADLSIATVNTTTAFVVGVTAGTTTITYRLPTGCTTTRGLLVNELAATTGGTTVCTSTPITLSNTTTAGGVWTSGNSLIARVGSATGTVTGLTGGTTSISFTVNGTGCRYVTPMVVSVCRMGGSSDPDDNSIVTVPAEFTLIPNPNTGEFTVKGTFASMSDEQVSIEIVNMLGQVVYRNNITALNGDLNERIQLGTNMASGSYILNLRTENERKVFHFVIGH